jgi:glyoxylase I family protein
MELQLHHVSLLVADTGRALGFYRDLLGLMETPRPDLGFPGSWLQVGALQIHLLELPSPDPSTGRSEHGGRDRHVAFRTADLREVTARLEAAGVPFTRSRSGRPAIFCRDPDGNAVEIVEAV